jgi:hypothetical protein
MRFKELCQKALKLVGGWFNYFLVTYLLLFLAENIVPGFVSNNFDLNYLLIPVIITGIAASMGPEIMQPAEKPGTIWDVAMSGGMAVLGGVLIYFKIELDFGLRLAISILSGILILSMSLLLISPVKFNITMPKVEIKKIGWIKPIVWMAILSAVYWAGTANLIKLPKKNDALAPADPTITIKVLNGSLDDEIAPSFTKLLVSNGYPKAFYGQADNRDYENATIKYPEEMEEQAKVIENLLTPIFPIIAKQPPEGSGSGEIIVILGNKINYQ